MSSEYRLRAVILKRKNAPAQSRRGVRIHTISSLLALQPSLTLAHAQKGEGRMLEARGALEQRLAAADWRLANPGATRDRLRNRLRAIRRAAAPLGRDQVLLGHLQELR